MIKLEFVKDALILACIMTYTKRRFDPVFALPEDICAQDIAHALSLLCRANGHFHSFYSVAQHSINCMREAKYRGYAKRIQLACLLHDASEAYISDVTRPVKCVLPQYREIEQRLQDIIWIKYLTSAPTQEEICLIDDIDDALLHREFQHFMGEGIVNTASELVSEPAFAHTSFLETEEEFLVSFKLLCE